MKYKIINGDCLKEMQRIPDDSIDLVLCDPPYGMNFVSGWRKEKYNRIANDDNLDFLDNYFEQCYSILKDNSAIYCFCSWHNVEVFKIAFERHFKLKNIIVWVKNNHGSGDLQAAYAPKYEFILYGNKGRCKFRNGRQSDVWNYAKTGNVFHPTQKPIDLLENCILNSTDEGGVVFDGFMGSGSTGVACVNTNRNFIGIELDGRYFDIAKKRINEAVI